jgi:hypothetical protein
MVIPILHEKCLSIGEEGWKQASIFSIVPHDSSYWNCDFNVGDFFVLGTEITSSHNQVSKKADIIVL